MIIELELLKRVMLGVEGLEAFLLWFWCFVGVKVFKNVHFKRIKMTIVDAYGHTTLKTRHLVRSVKLSNVGPG